MSLYSSSVMYAFVFPLIFTSGLTIGLSRYLADNIYTSNLEKLLPCLFGSLTVYLLFASPIGLIFYLLNPIDQWIKLGGYSLYIFTGLVFTMMIFVSAIKRYKQVSFSFAGGMAVAGLLSYLILNTPSFDALNKTRLLLGAFALGMGIVMIGILITIRQHFPTRSKNYFDFFIYIKRYPVLILYNVLSTLGLYVHNFIFWLFPQTGDQVALFLYCSDYDMATFLGMLTILPATVLFVVAMETNTYTYYANYIVAVNSAPKAVIDKAQSDLERNILQEYAQLIEVQAVVSLLLIVVGMSAFPYIGISSSIIETYPFLACGYYFSFMMFLTTTLMLYFESYRDACMTSLFFLVSNIIFTILSILMGSDFHGWGLVMGGGVSFLAAQYKLKKTIHDVNHIMFCSKALREEVSITIWDRLIYRLDGKKSQNEKDTSV
jgi:uncharacterized membrane protein